MNLTLQTYVSQSPRTASRVVNGRAVVVVIDGQTLYTLNTLGTFVWERADGRTLEAIVDEVVDEFEVDRERAERDVLAFAEQLAGLRALVPRPA
jgi:hypothetical protein